MSFLIDHKFCPMLGIQVIECSYFIIYCPPEEKPKT